MIGGIRLWLKVAAWTSILAVALVTIVPIGLRPTTPYSANLERFFVMAIVGALFVLAYPSRLWRIVIALAVAAAALEPLQFLALSRHPGISDTVFKVAGVVVGAVACHFLNNTVMFFRPVFLKPDAEREH